MTDMIKRIDYWVSFEGSDSPPPRIDVKCLVYDGKALDIMNNRNDILHFKSYLEHMFDKAEKKQEVYEDLLECIDQASSLVGQWKVECTTTLDSLLDTWLSVAQKTLGNGTSTLSSDEVLKILENFVKKHPNNKSLQEEIIQKKEVIKIQAEKRDIRNLPLYSLVYRAAEEAHPLDKMTTTTAVGCVGLVILANGITTLTTNPPA